LHVHAPQCMRIMTSRAHFCSGVSKSSISCGTLEIGSPLKMEPSWFIWYVPAVDNWSTRQRLMAIQVADPFALCVTESDVAFLELETHETQFASSQCECLFPTNILEQCKSGWNNQPDLCASDRPAAPLLQARRVNPCENILGECSLSLGPGDPILVDLVRSRRSNSCGHSCNWDLPLFFIRRESIHLGLGQLLPHFVIDCVLASANQQEKDWRRFRTYLKIRLVSRSCLAHLERGDSAHSAPQDRAEGRCERRSESGCAYENEDSAAHRLQTMRCSGERSVVSAGCETMEFASHSRIFFSDFDWTFQVLLDAVCFLFCVFRLFPGLCYSSFV